LTVTAGGQGHHLWRLMKWAREKTKVQGLTIADVLGDVRNKIDASVFQEEDKSALSTCHYSESDTIPSADNGTYAA